MPLTEDLIIRLEREIPGYNYRPLSVEDVERACNEAGVVLLFHPLPGYGLLFHRYSVPVIAVNHRLGPGHAAFVGFHEYFHHRFHPGSIHTYSGRLHWLDKVEIQASILAALAVIPTPRLREVLARGEPLAEAWPLPRYVLDFRLKVHQQYQDLIQSRRGQ